MQAAYKQGTALKMVFYRQAILRKGYKLLISVGFILVVAYQYYMYFLIHPNLNSDPRKHRAYQPEYGPDRRMGTGCHHTRVIHPSHATNHLDQS